MKETLIGTFSRLAARALKLDESILLSLQKWRTPSRTRVMTMITHLGDGGAVWFGLAGILLLGKKTRRAGVATIRALASSFVLVNLLLKNLVSRLRPYETVEGLRLLIRRVKDFSVPSGHSSSSVAAAVAMSKALPKWLRPFPKLLAGLIGFSRIYVGIHFPSDVLCGAIAGWLCGKRAAACTFGKKDE